MNIGLTERSRSNLFEGNKAPDFSLYNENNTLIKLSQLLKIAPVMVVFYPEDFTWICTKQLCAYQEAKETFKKFGILLVGISPNTIGDHIKFKDAYKFDFHLLSDPQNDVYKNYGLTSLFKLGGNSRANFIINCDGTILYRHVEATRATFRKVDELVAVLNKLNEKCELKSTLAKAA